MQERVIASLQRATDGGRRPVVCDASSCSEGLVDLLRETGITVIDAVEFVDTHVLPHLPPTVRIPRLTLHPTCSSVQLGISASLSRVAAAAAAKVVIPDEWACCGFAGDRGMLHPELTESATALEARTIREARPTEYASLNRTCEMGMSRATGKAYRHVLQVLDDAVARNA